MSDAYETDWIELPGNGQHPGTEELVVLGNGPSWIPALRLVEERGLECWGINTMNESIPHLMTLAFQMHGLHFVRARFVEHYLKFPHKCPLVMHSPMSELPNSIAFPMQEAVDYFRFTTE